MSTHTHVSFEIGIMLVEETHTRSRPLT